MNFRSPHMHAWLWASVVGVLMLLPGDAFPFPQLGRWLPQTFEGWIDKVEHLVAFAVMVVLVHRSLRASGRSQRPLLTAALLTLGYALLLELLQLVVPGRTWAPADLVADLVGVLLPLPIISRVPGS